MPDVSFTPTPVVVSLAPDVVLSRTRHLVPNGVTVGIDDEIDIGANKHLSVAASVGITLTAILSRIRHLIPDGVVVSIDPLLNPTAPLPPDSEATTCTSQVFREAQRCAIEDGNVVQDYSLAEVIPNDCPAVRQYGNEEQSYTASCPPGETGEDVTVTIPPDVFLADSVALANAEALASAQALAESELVCEPAGCTYDIIWEPSDEETENVLVIPDEYALYDQPAEGLIGGSFRVESSGSGIPWVGNYQLTIIANDNLSVSFNAESVSDVVENSAGFITSKVYYTINGGSQIIVVFVEGTVPGHLEDNQEAVINLQTGDLLVVFVQTEYSNFTEGDFGSGDSVVTSLSISCA